MTLPYANLTPENLRRLLSGLYHDICATLSGQVSSKEEFILFSRQLTCDTPSNPLNVEIKVFDQPESILDIVHEGYELGSLEALHDAIAPAMPGGKLYALFVKKKLAHFSRMMADRRDRNFGPFLGNFGGVKDICIGPCRTNPSFRGNGFYAMALNRICEDAGSRQQGNAYIYCALSNTSSINGIKKAKFKTMGRIVKRRFFIWTVIKINPEKD
ncbi:MAG: hypothetical protein CBB68_06765 [Rhodospirillaceae bacterium TMED8]|nr:hypothetical protein [Magnetovibrio sp.]MAH85457.1 hypothetical protein [Magnetovibrio sp.]OUT47961.1 MAG: hypothetical protein CBB68_14630 [Rhodospirillaceae bacterium TMED8]OUT51317.1 MAG: hypothetical protein CBB68_06765 [Rhodospirillaceae bacterium TMED8]|tara:strand:- start:360 stop:1001 length:642 start_codon:yes stop_codon:yes gene_type:complete